MCRRFRGDLYDCYGTYYNFSPGLMCSCFLQLGFGNRVQIILIYAKMSASVIIDVLPRQLFILREQMQTAVHDL